MGHQFLAGKTLFIKVQICKQVRGITWNNISMKMFMLGLCFYRENPIRTCVNIQVSSGFTWNHISIDMFLGT